MSDVDLNRLLIVTMCLSLIVYIAIDMSQTYVYEFVVSIPSYAGIGMNIIEIKVDDEHLRKKSVTHYQKTSTGLSYHMYDGDENTSASYTYRLNSGDKFMKVKLNRRPKKFSITYLRPNYAPGWSILENGKEILREKSNRGPAFDPSPVTYDYKLS